jgi:hypothetical protein
MKIRQLFRGVRPLAVAGALAMLAVLTLWAPPAAAAPPSGSVRANVLSQSKGASAPKAAQVRSARLATTCYASVGTPFRLGGNVAVDYSVFCDGPIASITGAAGIVRDGQLVGGSAQPFQFTGSGGGALIQRPCEAGALFGLMYAQVNFLSGTPLVLDGLFAGPAANITC